VTGLAELPRPIGYVLGGGASLGAIQVSVLQALSEHGVVPDLVAGTSVGSLKGAALARDPTSGANRLSHVWARMTTAQIFPGGLLAQARTLQQTKAHLFPSTGLAAVIEQFLGARIALLTTWSCRSPPSPWTSPRDAPTRSATARSCRPPWPAPPSPASIHGSTTAGAASTTAESSPTSPCASPSTWGPARSWSSTAPRQPATDPRRDLRRDHALHRTGRHAHGVARDRPRTLAHSSPSSSIRDL